MTSPSKISSTGTAIRLRSRTTQARLPGSNGCTGSAVPANDMLSSSLKTGTGSASPLRGHYRCCSLPSWERWGGPPRCVMRKRLSRWPNSFSAQAPVSHCCLSSINAGNKYSLLFFSHLGAHCCYQWYGEVRAGGHGTSSVEGGGR